MLLKMVGLQVFLLGMLQSCTPVFAWTVNDVSILLPLPKKDEIELLIAPGSKAKGGEVLPYEVFKNLPQLLREISREDLFQKYLKVIAIRLDPCFTEVNGPFQCQPQIRLVWQPVLQSGFSSITADAAIHSFYDLTKDEWDLLLKDLGPLSGEVLGRDGGEALDVHPQIKKEGLQGAHWTSLKKVILKYVGKHNISRATAMTVDTFGSIWTFSGVNIDEGFMTRIQIPRTQRIAQGFIADISRINDLVTSISPYPEGVPEWMTLVSDSISAKSKMSSEDMSKALEYAMRLENPHLEDPSTADCVSCHIAQTVHVWADKNLRAGWKDHLASSVFSMPGMNLENKSVNPGFSNRLRMFGYFVDEPIFAQRVINESAIVYKAVWELQSSINMCERPLKGE